MLLCKGLKLAFFGFLLAFTANMAHGQAHDLSQLLEAWTEVNKSESWSEHLEVHPMEIENEGNFFAEQIATEITQLPLYEISNFSYEIIVDQVRKKIIDKLFSGNTKIPSFCEAFSSTLNKLNKIDMNNIPEKEKIEKKVISSCKNQINQLLGGIFHANPKTYTFLHLQKEGNTSRGSHTVYIASLVEPKHYLKYTFRL
ncbi:MAG: hypothetical protein AB8G05_27010 [Oligoflexales bacterium]